MEGTLELAEVEDVFALMLADGDALVDSTEETEPSTVTFISWSLAIVKMLLQEKR